MANLGFLFQKINYKGFKNHTQPFNMLKNYGQLCSLRHVAKFCSVKGGDIGSMNYQSQTTSVKRFEKRLYSCCKKIRSYNDALIYSNRSNPLARPKDSRSISSDPYYTSPITVGMQDVLLNINSFSGLPWWATIMSTTIILRFLITLPLARQQAVTVAKLELMQPTINEIVEALKHNITIKGKRANKPVEEVNREFRIEARLHIKDIYKREKCNPLKLYILPWVQLPLWIVISLALRNLSGYFPKGENFDGTTLCHPDLIAGGFGWITDLSVSDPYYILPIIIGITNLMNIELNTLRKKEPSKRQIIITRVFRTLTIAMMFFASQVPSAMSLYWATSSSYGLLQNLILTQPALRRKLAIPKSPSESATPIKDRLDILKTRMDNFVKIQRK